MTPFCIRTRNPQEPDDNALSDAVTCQFAGSVVPACQALAESVVPVTLKRNEYDVPVLAAKATLPNLVSVPLTLF